MKTFLELDAFARAPVGARYRGRRFTYAMPNDGLALAVAGARFTLDDLRALTPLLDALRSFPRHSSLWDVSRIDDVQPDAFTGLQEYFASHFHDLLPIDRVAVVAPPKGPLRAAAAGMFTFLKPPYQVAAFTSPGEAVEWLGAPRDATLATLSEEVASLLASAFDDVVCAWVEAHATSASIEACAQGLRVSKRTLQRRLAERGTSFEAVANRARVRVALRLLKTDEPLTSIAYEAGFSSPERFSHVFREQTGETPSAARTRLCGSIEP